MSETWRRCCERTPRGKTCELPEGHAGDHSTSSLSSGACRIIAWPRVVEPPPVYATFDELIEHLADLVDLARYEGYGRLADFIDAQRRGALCDRVSLEARDAQWSAGS